MNPKKIFKCINIFSREYFTRYINCNLMCSLQLKLKKGIQ